ncbi:hypothetical protein EYF80_059717 [Liparis tanakae]|uniref:Uncharacterized protein n=1 Tax=Liparis tanakae TaxID=230148 RepID=A0A4Z2EP30_9TELE|nr:hypothetical protein EYF80_059717 [Liparis tanakae]
MDGAGFAIDWCTTSFWSRNRVRKYTLQAASTALWALKSTPSTTKVQSHSMPCLRWRFSCSRTFPLCHGNSIAPEASPGGFGRGRKLCGHTGKS